MKKFYISLLGLLVAVTSTFSQVAVNNTGSSADNSAMLDVQSTTKGLLVPRMTTQQRGDIQSPATGLLVFDTDENNFYYYDGSSWKLIKSGALGWTRTGLNIVAADTTYHVGIGTSNPGGTFEVATIKALGTYGSDQCSGGTASASSVYTTYTADRAFDDDNNTEWVCDNSLPATLQYDFGDGNKKRIAKYTIYFSNATNTDHSPNDWTFEASDDGTTWTTLDTQTGQGWTSNGIKEYSFTNLTLYRYYRLNISDNKGTGDNYVQINEVQMMEEELENHATLFVNDNKVGIGTSSPSSTLEINGTLSYVDGNEASGKVLVSDESGNATWTDGADVNGGGWSVNTNNIYNISKNVGIGTSTPDSPLTVNGRISETGTGKSVFLGDGAGANDDLSNNYNVFLGYDAGNSNTTGYDNTATGAWSLFNNTEGNYNTATGYRSLFYNAEGNYNTAIGYYTLYKNTTGGFNTATGSKALYSNTTGRLNTATGDKALYYNTEGDSNTAIGYTALYNNTTGSYNTATGSQALYYNTEGHKNTTFGNRALFHNTTGNYNTATGSEALYSNTTGSSNTAVGDSALFSNTTGIGNTAIGSEALYSISNKDYNTAIGCKALYSNVSGYSNTAVGAYSLYYNVGIWNTATGNYTLHSNTTGNSNTAVGLSALYYNTEGDENTATGERALLYNITGESNTAIGYFALLDNTTGSYNTAIGDYAGFVDSDLDNTTCIGKGSGGVSNVSNRVEIGNSSVSWIGGQVNWSTYSDARIKKDIKENVPGLEFITRLRPVTYHFDIHKENEMIRRGKDDKKEGDWKGKYDIEKKTMTGFIAQEVEKAAKECGYDFSGVEKAEDDLGMYSLSYAQFVVPLVKAVQEQQQIINEQSEVIKQLKLEIESIKKQLSNQQR